jgi:tetratricopeptide (TPR) repeat protein
MDNLNQRLEDFLDGQLSSEELELFLVELENNKDLTNEMNLRLEVNQLIKDKGFVELKDKLTLQLNNPNSLNPIFNLGKDFLRTWHLAAASFALILVVGGLWYILSNKPYSTEKLVTKYYKPAHPILQIRSVEVNNDDALVKAFKYYKESDYNNALKYFKSIENQITAKFYSGVCHIELEQYDQAIDSFTQIVNDNDNLFVEQAEWYLGLIYLMDNQKSRAIDQFMKISQSEGYYTAQANEIIKYLN